MTARRARIFAPVHEYIYALDAKTGTPMTTFGDSGRIDLRDDLGRDPKGAVGPPDNTGRRSTETS